MKDIWSALTLKDPPFNPLKLKTVCTKMKKFRRKWVIQSWLTPFLSCSLSNVFFLKYLFHCHHYYQTVLFVGVEEIKKVQGKAHYASFLWVRSAVQTEAWMTFYWFIQLVFDFVFQRYLCKQIRNLLNPLSALCVKFSSPFIHLLFICPHWCPTICRL